MCPICTDLVNKQSLATGRMQIRLAEAEASPHTGGLTDISGVAVALDCGGKVTTCPITCRTPC